MGFLLSNYQLTICILLYSLIFCFSSSAHLCHNHESTALLQFKQSFSFNCSVSVGCYRTSGSHNTDSWKEGTDCCAWDGVTCDNTTSHVIGLDLFCNCLYGTIHPNSSLFNLVHLQHLDLSLNNFNHSQILPSFGRFTNLTHLHLNYSYLSGPIQSSSEEVWQGNNVSNSIFHLQKLQVLWLYGNRKLTGKLQSFINGTLRHLRSLALSEIDFTGELPNSIGQLEYLEELYLYDCNLFGTIPTSLGNLKKLRMLALGGNNFNNGQFPSSIGHLKNLEELYLQSCNFFGTIPTSLGNLKKLRILYLPGNNLINDQFPSSIGHLKNLEELYLSDCNFSGTIPRSLTNLTRLIYLDLSYNNFEGPIPQLFSNFSQLQSIDFSNNQLTGPIPSSITGLPNLQSLYLGSNSINGTIPPSLFHLVNLTDLDLSSNNLSDTVELDTFAKLEYLVFLDLSNSGLSLTTTNSTPFSFRKIWTLQLSSCNISKIPEFLKTRKEFLEMLDLSNNCLNEELNPLCNLHSLVYLDLSNNQLAGLIPTCLGNFNGNLTLLNLKRNNFHGIPQTFGYASMLQELDISHNKLQGVLPRSLANCTNLEVLNVGHNFIEDAFPFWLENLPQLKIIVLRDNKFHGPIPRKRLAFTNLHIIDMSHNEFTGTLPSEHFESMHSMMMDDEDKSSLNYMGDGNGYYYSVTIMNKGLEMELVKIITIFKAVDFSHNKFHGNIPISIGRLKALYVLNFSGNGLTGLIPMSLGDLTKLESLDLSQNKLSGEIPQQLTKLTFLEVLNFSQNNLTGLIPRGGQFETFSNTSYEGNLGLCGFPLSKNCGNVQIAEPPTLPSSFSRNFKFKFDGFGWEAVLMGYACGALLGLLIGSCIIQRKEEWLVRIFGVKRCQHGKRSKKVWKKLAHTKSIINCL
ncbi:Receptor-like protein 12 [Camellia lanceoleosa]|uniref:Receptor-like protein 12 n=1 Tax=Camellia lanceoleosa TaxID=1840588 RepID=A0ACC0FPV9_9ERIC|nr:Receptor-like protein 12 [Camellia lanceoleosa]